jgi:predicted lipoprotein with Yx(FWY)xxD motif
MHKTIRLTAVGLALAAILAACSSSGGSTAPSAAAPSVAPSVAAPSVAASVAPSEAPSAAAASASAAPAGSAAVGTLALADTSKGKVIVDGEGRTLYLFIPDESAKKPTCYDTCAGQWPAFVSPGGAPTVGAGLDQSKVTVVDRTDGQKQVQYGNYPLYYFAGDSKAGDINGEGLGSKWYVVSSDGEEIK